MLFVNYKKYGKDLNSHDLIKFMAIATMVVDHIGMYFFPEMTYLRAVGRVAMPLFLFLAGYSLNYKNKGDIIFYGIALSLYSTLLYYPLFPLNILISIIASRTLLGWLEKKNKIDGNLLTIFVTCLFWWLPAIFLIDYSTTNILFIVCGYLVGKKPGAAETKKFLLCTFIFHFVTQPLIIDFILSDYLIFICICVFLFNYLKNYELKTYTYVKYKKMQPFVMFVSRNSLQIYFWHLIILKAIVALLDPGYYNHLRLIVGID